MHHQFQSARCAKISATDQLSGRGTLRKLLRSKRLVRRASFLSGLLHAETWFSVKISQESLRY